MDHCFLSISLLAVAMTTITIKRSLLHETAAPTKKEMIYVLTKNLNLLRPP
jgi:hypothetical protein